MSHSSTEISVRNVGRDCTLPASPGIAIRDARGRIMASGTAPGRTKAAIRLGGGHRAAADLRWVSAPVYPRNRRIRSDRVTVHWSGATLHAALAAVLYGPAARPLTFDQAPLRVMAGAAAD
jgi:hypothetical protein